MVVVAKHQDCSDKYAEKWFKIYPSSEDTYERDSGKATVSEDFESK